MTGSPGQTRPLMRINMTLSWAKICKLIFFQILVGTCWYLSYWVYINRYWLVLGCSGYLSSKGTHPDDHMQKASQSRWSFAKGQPIQMIICKRRPIWMINCKRPVDLDDHLLKASSPRWSFAIGWPIWMIIYKRQEQQQQEQPYSPSR